MNTAPSRVLSTTANHKLGSGLALRLPHAQHDAHAVTTGRGGAGVGYGL